MFPGYGKVIVVSNRSIVIVRQLDLNRAISELLPTKYDLGVYTRNYFKARKQINSKQNAVRKSVNIGAFTFTFISEVMSHFLSY